MKVVDVWGVDNGHHQQCLIDIRSEDMTLFGEVDAFPDDVIAAVFNGHNPIALTYRHPVAYGHRIGGANSLDAEIALHLTLKELAIVG